jgi:hypothetical protein
MLPTVTVIPSSLESLSAQMGGSGAPTSAAFPTSNRAIFIPFRLSRPTLFVKMFTWNGTTASGNIDVGLYDKDGTRIVSKGSTAHTGTSVIQEFDITDTLLNAGLFYLAVAMDNSTAHLFRKSVNNVIMKFAGCYQMASAFPLPATATFAAVSNSYIPIVGATTRSVI